MFGAKHAFPLALLACACGLGPFDTASGGDENLPQSGAGPYLFPPADFDTPADEPYILAQPIVSLTDLDVVLRDDGVYEVFYTRTSEEGSAIWRVELVSLTELPGEPSLVLAPDQAWEESVVRAPSVVVRGSEQFLYYEGGEDEPCVGLAISRDGGRTFEKHAANPLAHDARDPDVVVEGERWLMVHGDPDGRGIHLREGAQDDFGAPRTLFEARLGVPNAFDASGVAAPALRIQVAETGRAQYGLFYAGIGPNADGEPVSSIGYQGSFDLESWEAFLGGEPILDAGPAGAGGPSPLLFGAHSLLFVHQPRQGRGRLAVAFGP